MIKISKWWHDFIHTRFYEGCPECWANWNKTKELKK